MVDWFQYIIIKSSLKTMYSNKTVVTNIPFQTKHGSQHRIRDAHYSNSDSIDMEADLNM